MTSHGSNYVPEKHPDFSQHDPYAKSSEMTLWYSYPASFKNQTDWVIALMNSFDTNYILIDDKDLGQYDLYAMPDNGMLQLSGKFDVSKWNHYSPFSQLFFHYRWAAQQRIQAYKQNHQLPVV